MFLESSLRLRFQPHTIRFHQTKVSFANMTLSRKNITLLIFVFLTIIEVKGQIDSIEEASLSWMKENLTYNYYNPDQGKWWLNKMEYNLAEGTIHLQNASTTNPRKLRDKSWIDRRVHLSNLDPYSIRVSPVLQNKGRVVEGQVLLIDVVHNEKKIRKSIDGRQATAESFLQFSIPASLLDTAAGFADSLKFHLTQAIEAQSLLKNAGNMEENVGLVFQFLRGEFLSGSITRTYDPAFKYVIAFEEKQGAKPIRKGYFGFAPEQGLFFETLVSDDRMEVNYYRLGDDEPLVLINTDDASQVIDLMSLLHFSEIRGAIETEYRRIRY